MTDVLQHARDSRATGYECPMCFTTDMVQFGGKLRCPHCFYIQPCCQP